MRLEEALNLSMAIEYLNELPQKQEGLELVIGKNDPKNGCDDYWWCTYGEINLSNYYSLSQMLIDLWEACLEYNYKP